METHYDAITHYLERHKWQYRVLEKGKALGVSHRCDNGRWGCIAGVDGDRLICYSVFPDGVSEARRTEVALLLTRANFGMLVGNFEIDLDDGELRFKTSVYLRQRGLSDEIIEPVLYTNLTTVDTYFPWLKGIVSGDLSGEAAIRALHEVEPRDG